MVQANRKGDIVARVFIVEDHPVVRKGYVAFISREPGMEVCGEALSLIHISSPRDPKTSRMPSSA